MFPQSFTGSANIKYGAAFGITNVTNSFVFNYNVSNQINRRDDFQVLVLDAPNWALYLKDTFPPTCLNPSACNIHGTQSRWGEINSRIAPGYAQDFWIVIRNRNLVQNSILTVRFAAWNNGKR